MLTGIEFGKGYPGVGIDKGLLVNPANPFDGPDIIGVLGTEISGMFRFYFSVGFLLLFFALQGYNLCFGKDKPIVMSP